MEDKSFSQLQMCNIGNNVDVCCSVLHNVCCSVLQCVAQLQMCNIGNNADYRGMAAIHRLYELSGLFWKNAI